MYPFCTQGWKMEHVRIKSNSIADYVAMKYGYSKMVFASVYRTQIHRDMPKKEKKNNSNIWGIRLDT